MEPFFPVYQLRELERLGSLSAKDTWEQTPFQPDLLWLRVAVVCKLSQHQKHINAMGVDAVPVHLKYMFWDITIVIAKWRLHQAATATTVLLPAQEQRSLHRSPTVRAMD